jgi:hypothetical protein
LVLIQNKAICHQFGTSDSSSTIEELAPFENLRIEHVSVISPAPTVFHLILLPKNGVFGMVPNGIL